MNPELIYSSRRCISCDGCISICPSRAIKKDHQGHRIINRHVCDNCSKCVDACPTGALQMAGRWVTPEDVLREVQKDELFYQNSGGGVTLSGGEPLAQPDFVQALLKMLKGARIHTAMETCGYANWLVLERMLDWLDLILYDIKHMNPVKHKKLTGHSNELILKNARRIAKTNSASLVIRVPVIPSCNDSPENIQAIADFSKNLGNVEEVHLLPYHRLGESKYDRGGRQYKLENIEPPSQSSLNKLKDIIRSKGLKVHIVGAIT